jgi:hypothetical protein
MSKYIVSNSPEYRKIRSKLLKMAKIKDTVLKDKTTVLITKEKFLTVDGYRNVLKNNIVVVYRNNHYELYKAVETNGEYMKFTIIPIKIVELVNTMEFKKACQFITCNTNDPYFIIEEILTYKKLNELIEEVKFKGE